MQQNILFTIKRHALRLTHKVFPKRWLSQDGSKLVPVSAKVYNWQMLKTFHKLFFRVDFLVISFHRPSQLRVAATAQSALGTNLVLQELSLGIHSPECQVICKACKMDEFESRRIYHFLSAMNMCSFDVRRVTVRGKHETSKPNESDWLRWPIETVIWLWGAQYWLISA